jgi:uridylate kinase
MKATTVDGIYDSDPMKNPDAKKYDVLDYTTVLTDKLRVMDATAISLCRENKLPILVFDLTRKGNILRVLQGESIGTLVKGD